MPLGASGGSNGRGYQGNRSIGDCSMNAAFGYSAWEYGLEEVEDSNRWLDRWTTRWGANVRARKLIECFRRDK